MSLRDFAYLTAILIVLYCILLTYSASLHINHARCLLAIHDEQLCEYEGINKTILEITRPIDYWEKGRS